MELGFVGLGRMGMNMVRRLQRDRHRVVSFDRSPEVVKESVRDGAIGAGSLKDLVAQLTRPKIADLWMNGSVVRSWLLELAASALKQDPQLEQIKGYVEDCGEGRWTVFDAIEKGVPAPVLTASLYTRFRSRQQDSFAERMLAALRNAFGGHAVRKA